MAAQTEQHQPSNPRPRREVTAGTGHLICAEPRVDGGAAAVVDDRQFVTVE